MRPEWGPHVEREVVRAMMLLRARSLSMGYSGVRPLLVDRILAMLNAGITPVVHEYGSLGASGDLAPLAHAALPLIGEGMVVVGGEEKTAAQAVAAEGWSPIDLESKEGLALINGTDGILGMLLLALHDLETVMTTADIVGAMTVEALLGTDRAFAADLVGMRPQLGQMVSAANMTAMLAGSEIVQSHRHDDVRVQDAYSLRYSPQVHGAARDAWSFASGIADRELQSAIDNPVVMPDGRVESCGNFHGAPLGLACDALSIGAVELGAIAERRTDRMLDPARSMGLPPFLTEDPGVSSGLMIAHYTAAGIVSENRRLASPASVDSLPTSAMQEDHVSMAWGAARKLRRIVENVARVLAVELVAASQATELRMPLRPSPAAGAVVCETERVRAPSRRRPTAFARPGGSNPVDPRRLDRQRRGRSGAARRLTPGLRPPPTVDEGHDTEQPCDGAPQDERVAIANRDDQEEHSGDAEEGPPSHLVDSSATLH